MRQVPPLKSLVTPTSVAFAVIALSAFVTRLLPLAFSQYPFNNDSLFECGLASDLILHGHLEYSEGSPWEGTYSVGLPAFGVLLAHVSSVLGTTPIVCAQIIVAVFSMLTVGAVFLLGREFSGTTIGGIIASMAALLSGTFVFTTGSAWKLSLGFALTALLYFAFIKRDLPRYRLLTLSILCMLVFVHHLAAAVSLIAFAFMLFWSWTVALSRSNVTGRLWADTATVLLPAMVASFYYSVALEDRQDVYASGVKVAVFLCIFLTVCVVAFYAMRERKRRIFAFAPLVGAVIGTILLLDYFGFVFPYQASAPPVYIMLIISTAVLLTVAWYGTELIVMKRREFMTVQLCLILAPLIVILFGIGTGSQSLSLKFVYRTFDFLQFFVFLGIGVAIADLGVRRPRASRLTCIAVTVSLVCSFPFGFFTHELLGVRHDSQGYELDSMYWLSEHAEDPDIVSDERLAYMASSTIWIEKRASLPYNIVLGKRLSPGYFYMAEDSWTVTGVNVFPEGLAVIDPLTMNQIIEKCAVVYVGGPAEDKLYIFTSDEYISYSA
jgi:hypothetical protein